MGQTAEDLVTSLNSRDVQRRLQEYRALLANDTIGILAICDGEVMQCNASAARLFGWLPERLLGQSAAVFFSSENEFQGFANRIGDALNAGGSPAMEWRTRRADGSTFWCRLLVKSITPGGPGGETIWIVEDITSRKATETALSRVREELEQRVRAAHDELAWSNERLVAEMYERSEVEERARRMSLYDSTTMLPNRRLLESRLDEAVRNHQMSGDRLAVLVIDIDDFTKLNDALGHRVGDSLLQQVAGRLIETVRTSDLVARVGSDEFAVVLGRLRHTDDAERVAAKLSELLAEPYEVDAEQITATVSIGVALLSERRRRTGDAAAQCRRRAVVSEVARTRACAVVRAAHERGSAAPAAAGSSVAAGDRPARIRSALSATREPVDGQGGRCRSAAPAGAIPRKGCWSRRASSRWRRTAD